MLKIKYNPKIWYLLIALILALNCWDLIIVAPIINNQTNSVFAVGWAIIGFFWFRNRPGYLRICNFKKHLKYFYWLIAGFSLSIIPAYIFWNQDFITSFIVNRRLIWYIFLPMILYVQPTQKEIIRVLVYYTFVYMVVWTIQAVTPFPLMTPFERTFELGGSFELDQTDFGYLLPGYSIMLLLLYFKTQQFIENANLKTFLPALAMLAIFFILQNRGTLFFAVIVFGYALFRLQSKYKIILFLFFGILVLITYVITSDFWLAQVHETTDEISNPDYNRWKAYYYFVFEYSPNWICNLLGNGFLSIKESGGLLLNDMKMSGFYQSDIGILGFWSKYGVLPVIVCYTLVLKILINKHFPFYLKALSAHILLVPIVWAFDTSDIFIIIILCYLYAYYVELKRMENPKVFNLNVSLNHI